VIRFGHVSTPDRRDFGGEQRAAIKTVVVTRVMPPWFADPNYGHFANDRRLSDADVSKLSA